MAAPIRQVVKELPAWRLSLRRWAYNLSGFAKYGLYMDDCRARTPVVQEAIRRLPPDIKRARHERLSRALHLSTNKSVLPKSERHTADDDVAYLRPYMDEVERENEEMRNWKHSK